MGGGSMDRQRATKRRAVLAIVVLSIPSWNIECVSQVYQELMPSIANFCPVSDTECTLLCNRNIHQLRTRARTIGIKCVQNTFGSGLYLYHLRLRKHNVLPGVPVFVRRSVRTFWAKRNAALSMWHMCGEVDCWKHNQTHIRTLCTVAPLSLTYSQ